MTLRYSDLASLYSSETKRTFQRGAGAVHCARALYGKDASYIHGKNTGRHKSWPTTESKKIVRGIPRAIVSPQIKRLWRRCKSPGVCPWMQDVLRRATVPSTIQGRLRTPDNTCDSPSPREPIFLLRPRVQRQLHCAYNVFPTPPIGIPAEFNVSALFSNRQ